MSSPIEPSAIWSTRGIIFDKINLSIIQNVIMSQGRFALLTMMQKIDFLYSIVSSDINLNAIYPHLEIPETLTELCLHQGIASNIMFNNSEKSHKESGQSYKMRVERYKYTKNLCDNANAPYSILSRAMRKPNTGWYIDVAVSHRNQFTAPGGIEIGFCRSLIVSEAIIRHLDVEISLRGLRQEANAVLEAVFGNPPIPPPPALSHNPQDTPPWPAQTKA